MITVRFDSLQFTREMENITKYSEGFFQGAKSAQSKLIDSVGKNISDTLEEFIDANARTNPSALHHVYEWNQTGSPAARLFDIKYIAKGGGLTVNYTFRQSFFAKDGASKPFYDKARIMEDGVPVVIRPVKSSVLRFEDGGEDVFTKKPIEVNNPGGQGVQGSFEANFKMFFDTYLSQAFLQVSGIAEILANVGVFSKNLPSGKSGGKSAGFQVGYAWMSNVRGAI